MGLFSKIKKVATKPFSDTRKVVSKLPGGNKINNTVNGVVGALPGGKMLNSLAFGVDPKAPMGAAPAAATGGQPDLSGYATTQQLDDYYAKLMNMLSQFQSGGGQSSALQSAYGGVSGGPPVNRFPINQPNSPMQFNGSMQNQASMLNNLSQPVFRGNDFTARGGFGVRAYR